MILAVVGAVHAYDLLPYYLKHYRTLGVERFAISCRPDELDPTGELKHYLGEQSDVAVVDLPRGFRRSNLVGMVEEETRASVASAADWVIPADLDELNQYPDDLHTLARTMEEGGLTHITGHMRDRLAPDG